MKYSNLPPGLSNRKGNKGKEYAKSKLNADKSKRISKNSYWENRVSKGVLPVHPIGEGTSPEGEGDESDDQS